HALAISHSHAELVVGDGADRITFAITAHQHRVHVTASTASAEAGARMLATKSDLEHGLHRRGLELGSFALGGETSPRGGGGSGGGGGSAPPSSERESESDPDDSDSGPASVHTIA